MIRHQALTLSFANRLAKIRFGMQTEVAFSTLGRVEGNHMIAGLHRLHALANLYNNAGTLMPQYRGKSAFRVIASKRERIGMAHTRCFDFHHDLAGSWPLNVHLCNFQRRASFKGNRRSALHINTCNLSLSHRVVAESAHRPRPSQGKQHGTPQNQIAAI
jgi:hypothetical protein